MLLALRELEKRGARRLGYATRTDQDDRVNHNWLGAFLAHRHAVPAEDRVEPLLAPELDQSVIKEWIQRERPDAVISNWPSVPALIREAGFDVPGEIAFASLDLFPERHAFAGIDQIPKAVGAAAADLVVKQIQNNEVGLPEHPVTMLLNGVWRDGPTVRKAKAPTRKSHRVART
jgi:LacI family transcriptional regulator